MHFTKSNSYLSYKVKPMIIKDCVSIQKNIHSFAMLLLTHNKGKKECRKLWEYKNMNLENYLLGLQYANQLHGEAELYLQLKLDSTSELQGFVKS